MDPAHIALTAAVMLAAALTAVLLCLMKTRKNAMLLKKQLDSAIEANNIRTSFFPNMVHELKMPLSIILGRPLIENKLKIRMPGLKKLQMAPLFPQNDYMTEKNRAILKCNCYGL